GGVLGRGGAGPGAELRAVGATARHRGKEYRLNGKKAFITNGQLADLIIVVAKTGPGQGAKGISLVVLETAGAEGFRRGRNLDKIGLHASDTSELFFDDVAVPTANLLATDEGSAFYHLIDQLPHHRLA